MQVSKKKGFAFYFLSGMLAVFLIVAGLVYVQLRDLDNLKGMVVQKLEDISGHRISIGAMELDFTKGVGLRLHDIVVGPPERPRQQFSARSAWVVIELWPLLDQEVEIRKFIAQGTSFQLIRDEQGRLNVGDFRRILTDSAESSLFKMFAISFIHQFSIEDGEIEFLDYYNMPSPEPLAVTVKNVNLSVNKRLFQSPFSFSLSGKISNAHRPTAFNFSGTFDPLGGKNGVQPTPIRGRIQVEQLDIPQFQPYLEKVLHAVPEDGWLSLESDFSGSLGGNLRSEGKLKYSIASMGRTATLRSSGSSNRGVVDYSVVLNKGAIELQNFELQAGSMTLSAHGRMDDFLSKNPPISFVVQTGKIQIGKTREYFPVVFFPESVHRDIDRRFRNGTVEIKSLAFDGSLEQLRGLSLEQNGDLLSIDIILHHVDLRSPLPPLKNVTGSFNYQNGNGMFKIFKARYEDFPLANIKGTVLDVMRNPVADFSIKNQIELEKLNRALKNAIAGESFSNILDDYQDFSGNGLLRVNVRGPLGEPDKISIAGTLSMENASFYEAEMKTRIKNFSGNIQYHRSPEKKQKTSSPAVPIISYKNLSGEFGKSAFFNLQGEITRDGEKMVRNMTAQYRLNFEELPGVIADIDFEGPFSSILKQAEFFEGDVVVDYRNFMDFNRPELEKEWGEIELKNVSARHLGFQPLLRVTGGISFGDGRVRLREMGGWYGSSPIQLDGRLTPKSGLPLHFDVRATLTDWTPQSDFEGIPTLTDFKFSGPVNADLTLTGNRRSFKFKNKINLTRAGYQFYGDMRKRENVPNQLNVRGVYSEKKGIAIDHFEFALDKERVTGKAWVKSFLDPEYSIKLQTSGFKTHPVASAVDELEYNQSGEVDLDISGRGHLSRIEDSLFEGSMGLKNLVFKWEGQAHPVTLSADIRFSDQTYNLRVGKLKSEHSDLKFSGMLKNGKRPELTLELTGKSLVLDELIPTGGEEEETDLRNLLEQSRFFSQGASSFTVDLGSLSYKRMVFNDVLGKFLLKDREIKIDRIQIGSLNPIVAIGKFSVKDPEAIRFGARIRASNIEAEELLGIFGNTFKGGLTGKVKKLNLTFRSRGRKLSEFIRSLNGEASVRLRKGEINTKKLHAGAFNLMGLEMPVRRKSKPAEDESSNYKNIYGNFIYVGGVAETEDFVYETKQRRTSIVGKFDLNRRRINAMAGVAHMPQLDKFLTQIPLVGKVLTGGDDASLVITYHSVKGPFDDPIISLVPFETLGKKVMGIFQGILQTSEEILTLPADVMEKGTTN